MLVATIHMNPNVATLYIRGIYQGVRGTVEDKNDESKTGDKGKFEKIYQQYNRQREREVRRKFIKDFVAF